MNISIVIPAYNEELYLERCLSSVGKYRTDDILEVIVVDNCSTDRTAKIAKQFPFATVVTETQKGNSYARQKGLVSASGELVAFLDADSGISKDWVQKAINEFSRNKNTVALSGPCVFYDASGYYSVLVWIYFNIFVIPFSKITPVASLANFVVRKDAIIKIGGFDTTIAFYGDDTNIIRRLRKIGKVYFRKNFFIYTSARRLQKEGIIKTVFIYVINHFSEKLLHKQITKNYIDVR